MDQIKIKLPTVEISDEFVSPTEYLRLIVTQQAEHLGLLDGENADAYCYGTPGLYLCLPQNTFSRGVHSRRNVCSCKWHTIDSKMSSGLPEWISWPLRHHFTLTVGMSLQRVV